jgi:hypothetical protein
MSAWRGCRVATVLRVRGVSLSITITITKAEDCAGKATVRLDFEVRFDSTEAVTRALALQRRTTAVPMRDVAPEHALIASNSMWR